MTELERNQLIISLMTERINMAIMQIERNQTLPAYNNLKGIFVEIERLAK